MTVPADTRLREAGLEPARVSPPEPKSGASANSATLALACPRLASRDGSILPSASRRGEAGRPGARHRAGHSVHGRRGAPPAMLRPARATQRAAKSTSGCGHAIGRRPSESAPAARPRCRRPDSLRGGTARDAARFTRPATRRGFAAQKNRNPRSRFPTPAGRRTRAPQENLNARLRNFRNRFLKPERGPGSAALAGRRGSRPLDTDLRRPKHQESGPAEPADTKSLRAAGGLGRPGGVTRYGFSGQGFRPETWSHARRTHGLW